MPRAKIARFELANRIYASATVTVKKSSDNTNATLYAGLTGSATLTNPQRLDHEGKFLQPVYHEDAVYMSITGLSVGTHTTGVIPQPETFSLSNVINPVVNTIAALKALSGVALTGVVFALGYYAAGDLGGGLYYWDAASAATDNGGTIIRPNSLPATGRWKLKYEREFAIGQFGAKTDGTSATTAIQAALNAAISGDTVTAAAGTYVTGALTYGTANVKIELNKGAVLSFPTLGAGTNAITVNADNFEIENGKLQGPATGVYVVNERGISMVGTSTGVRKSGLRVRGTEITAFGSHGVYGQFVNNIDLSGDFYIHDCGYAGYMFLSCDDGYVGEGRIDNITPGTTGNMYGGSLTHDSTNYSADPNAGTKQAAHPFCRGWRIGDGLEVSRVNWEGLDCHGGYEVTIMGARVYATLHGISMPSSSGAAANYAGHAEICAHNIIDGRHKDGSASGYENLSYGINLNGGSTVQNSRVICHDNIIRYKGLASNLSAGVIQAIRCRHLNLHDNIIDQWNGNGLLVSLSGGILANNIFGAMASAVDTVATCIKDGGPTTYPLTLNANQHNPEGGNAAAEGFRQSTTATVRPVLTGNNFSAATTPYALGGANTGFCLGTDVEPMVHDGSAGATLTVAALAGWHGTLVLTSNGSYSVNTINGMADGQVLRVMNTGTGTATLTRAGNMVLDGGANQDLTQYDTLSLLKYATLRQVGATCVNS